MFTKKPVENGDLPALLNVKTSTEARANIAKSETWTADTAREIERLEAERTSALLNGSDEDVDALDGALQAARRRRDRLAATIQRLGEQALDLEAAELRTAAREAIARAKAGHKKYPAMLDKYQAAANLIGALVAETIELNQVAFDARKLAKEAGLDNSEWDHLTTPAGMMSTPDQKVVKDVPGGVEEGTIKGRHVLDLERPPWLQGISLPAPFGGAMIVQRGNFPSHY
ncbi:hypothetical protein [uncultured Thiodictyon sp.]|uniref:hypothetical protein n=1 Tax=uncultured Thiodictyon sp. TaxID=1846217 RepID=UPI0025D62182|nr:hypothetical protein [uncultured Thiodictyon sp.]